MSGIPRDTETQRDSFSTSHRMCTEVPRCSQTEPVRLASCAIVFICMRHRPGCGQPKFGTRPCASTVYCTRRCVAYRADSDTTGACSHPTVRPTNPRRATPSGRISMWQARQATTRATRPRLLVSSNAVRSAGTPLSAPTQPQPRLQPSWPEEAPCTGTRGLLSMRVSSSSRSGTW